jgi:alpha-glucuronidase
VYQIVVQYFDESDGASRFTLSIGDRRIDTWIADDTFPSREPNGHTSTRRVMKNVRLSAGDVIKIDAAPDKDEFAVVDYIEITPQM